MAATLSRDPLESSTTFKSDLDLEGQHAVLEKDIDAAMSDVDDVPSKDVSSQSPQQAQTYPTGLKLLAITAPLYMSIFLVALDRTIVATAVPRITDDFKSFGDIEWYGSAYLLTTASFMLLLGRVYTFFNAKWTYMACVALFELGSLLCGVAPNSDALIVGRAIAGLGSAGIFNGGIIIIINIVPLHKRPLFQASFAAIFGISSVIGPLLGGVFTTDVTWRLCFYINLPFGVISLALLFFFLELPKKQKSKIPLLKQIAKLDLIGTPLFIGTIVCLLLALQWGGSTYAWSDGRVIALFVVFAVSFIAYMAVQFLMPATASLPLHIFKNRTVCAATASSFVIGATMQVVVYYTAVWLQAIKGTTAIRSGVLTIPMVVGMVFGSIGAGAIVQKTGWYNPLAITGSCIMPIGAGLLTLLRADSDIARFQVIVLYGFGLGMCMQQSNLAIQAVLPMKDVSSGISVVMMMQTLGGAICIAIAQSVLNNKLATGLAGIPGLSNASDIVTNGATSLRTAVAPQYLESVLVAYNAALIDVFYVALALALLAIPCALSLEWKNLKKQKEAQAEQMKKAQEEKEKETEVKEVV